MAEALSTLCQCALSVHLSGGSKSIFVRAKIVQHGCGETSTVVVRVCVHIIRSVTGGFGVCWRAFGRFGGSNLCEFGMLAGF